MTKEKILARRRKSFARGGCTTTTATTTKENRLNHHHDKHYSPPETRSAKKRRTSLSEQPTDDEDHGAVNQTGGCVLTFSPPDQKENARREKAELEEKERARYKANNPCHLRFLTIFCRN
jgi:hypothetical protein